MFCLLSLSFLETSSCPLPHDVKLLSRPLRGLSRKSEESPLTAELRSIQREELSTLNGFVGWSSHSPLGCRDPETAQRPASVAAPAATAAAAHAQEKTERPHSVT